MKFGKNSRIWEKFMNFKKRLGKVRNLKKVSKMEKFPNFRKDSEKFEFFSFLKKNHEFVKRFQILNNFMNLKKKIKIENKTKKKKKKKKTEQNQCCRKTKKM